MAIFSATYEWVWHRESLPVSIQSRFPECGGCLFRCVEADDDSLPVYYFEAWRDDDDCEPFEMTDADRNHMLDVIEAWENNPALTSRLHNFHMNPGVCYA